MYVVHVLSYMYGVHARRTCTPCMCDSVNTALAIDLTTGNCSETTSNGATQCQFKPTLKIARKFHYNASDVREF